MILMRAISIMRAIGRGGGPEIETFFVPERATSKSSEWHLGPKNSNGLSIGFAGIKIIRSERHVKKQVHW